MSGSIGQRKADHIALCATGDVGFRTKTTLLEGVRFLHNALPDLDYAALDLRCTLFGKALKAPIVIAAMTGGTEEAGRINRELAAIAEERGYGFGLGSQRAMHRRKETEGSYRVRDAAPTIPVFGNIGIVQAKAMSSQEVSDLVADVGADALCVHLNPAMELVQPGGDRDFRGGLSTLERLVGQLTVPVIVKETGCGLSRDVGERIRRVGARHVDVSGAGGTSWVAVETHRAAEVADTSSHALGQAFWDWGIPTGASVGIMAQLGFETIIATGGIASGLDVARALALGATVAGIARPALKALHEGGRAGAMAYFDQVERELKAVMLLTASPTVHALASAPRMIVGELGEWLHTPSKSL